MWVVDYFRPPRPAVEVLRNHQFLLPDRKFELDISIPSLKMGIEVDGYGGGHQMPKGFIRDREKDVEAWLAGWQVFRFATTQVRDGSAYRLLERIIPRRVEQCRMSRSST